jgi:hypothetical protein
MEYPDHSESYAYPSGEAHCDFESAAEMDTALQEEISKTDALLVAEHGSQGEHLLELLHQGA